MIYRAAFMLGILLPAAAHADAKSSEISKLFQDFCLSAQPSMSTMQAKAASLGGTPQTDRTVPRGQNRSLHEQTWLARRAAGIYQLTAMQGSMAAGPNHVVGCGITAPDANGADLAQTLATEAGLGAPARRLDPSGDKGASIVWNKAFGPNQAKILVSYGAPNRPGASIHMILPNLPN
jgi:hypothetical protein